MRLPTKDAILGVEIKPTREYGDVDSGHDGEKNRLDVARQEKLDNFTHYKRVSDYLLGKTIGEGSFARVRLGLHVHTAHEVAVKIISKAKASKDAYVHKNLRREGRILQMARHQNIIQVYDILETYNNYYLVTEYCGGGELIDIVTDRGGLPESDVRKYVSQLVSAVAHLHDHGIVHRDLKVENLILDQFGDLKVIDFGLSNVVHGDAANPYGALSTQCGSPAYAAPELLAKKAYGPNVDVWSIGVITYAMIVGKLPFSAEPFRIPVLCRKMMAGDMNPIPSHLSYNCRTFIKRLMTPEPKLRPRIQQVQRMPWVEKMVTPSTLYGAPGQKANSRDTVDNDIVNEMVSKYGFESTKVSNCVRKNRPGEALTMYFLLSKQKRKCKNPLDKGAQDFIEDHHKDTEEQTAFDSSELPDSSKVTQNHGHIVKDCDQSTTVLPCTEKTPDASVAINVKCLPLASDELVNIPEQSCSVNQSHPNENLPSTLLDKRYDQEKLNACIDLHPDKRIPDMNSREPNTCESTKYDVSHTHRDQLILQSAPPKDRSKSSCSLNHTNCKISRPPVLEIMYKDTNEIKQSPSAGISRSEHREKDVETAADVNSSPCEFDTSHGHGTFKKLEQTRKKPVARVMRSLPPHEPPKFPATELNTQSRPVTSRDSRHHSMSLSKRSNSKITPLFTSIFDGPRRMTNANAVNSLVDGHVYDRNRTKRRSENALPHISVQGNDAVARRDLLRNDLKYKSRTMTSREMTKSLKNRGSVRQMIQKFDGMTDNELFTSRQSTRITANPTRSNVTGNDENHRGIRRETTEKFQYGRQTKPDQRLSGTKYLANGIAPYPNTRKYDNSNFLFFFRGRSREIKSGTDAKRSASPPKERKQNGRGLWYKSLV